MGLATTDSVSDYMYISSGASDFTVQHLAISSANNVTFFCKTRKKVYIA